MKVFIADKLAPLALEALEGAGHKVIYEPSAKGEELIEGLRQEQPQVLVVRSTKVPAQAMEACPALELIVRAGAGYDNIDVAAASRRGIYVSNCPGKNAAAVAELTIGLMVALDRRIPDNVIEIRQGHWNKAEYSKARGLKGRTLGVIGLGNIGREVVRRAQALGMRVVGWSRSLTDEKARELGIVRKMHPLDVARESDVVSLHVAATPETRHLANRAFFEAMKEGAYFINTSRSALVDEAALLWALEEKRLRAGLDVVEGEPQAKEGPFSHPLARHPRVYITHHIGASTEEAAEAVALEAVRVIQAYEETGKPVNVVNLEERSPANYLLTVRHLDKVGVLASVLDEVRKANWNVQEMENIIFAGAEAACARIRFHGEAQEDVVERIRQLPDVLAVSLIPLK